MLHQPETSPHRMSSPEHRVNREQKENNKNLLIALPPSEGQGAHDITWLILIRIRKEFERYGLILSLTSQWRGPPAPYTMVPVENRRGPRRKPGKICSRKRAFCQTREWESPKDFSIISSRDLWVIFVWVKTVSYQRFVHYGQAPPNKQQRHIAIHMRDRYLWYIFSR